MSIIFAILIFSFLIFIHEFGHFITAKLSGVRVNEFAIGMGPAIFKKQVGVEPREYASDGLKEENQ